MPDPVLAAFARQATDTPDAPAILAGDSAIPYRALADTVLRAAAFVAGQGIGPGMVVGIGAPDALLHAIMILASEACGAATLSFGELEVRDLANGLTRCDAVFSAWLGLSHPRVMPLDDDAVGAIMRTPPAPLALLGDAAPAARVLYSSGTTGAQRLISLGPEAMAAILRSRLDLIDQFAPDAALFLCPYGPVQDRAMTYVRAMLVRGGTVAFDFPASTAAIGSGDPAWFTMVLPNHVRLMTEAFEVSHLRHKAAFVDINGAAVDPRTHDLALRLLADQVVVNYGAKEATGLSFVDRDGVGTLGPGVQVRIDHRAGLPAGAGLIAVRAPTLATRYLGDAAQSAARFQDGWFLTGDVGFQPAPDQLVVLGRADDLLNVGGEKLAPGPLEADLCAACDITAAVLLTVPDADGIERLCILIERDDPIGDTATRQRIAEVIGHHAEIARTMFLAEFPRNEAGKVRRDALRAAVPDAPPLA